MKVAVTGGTGFVGSALVPALLARGDRVTVISRDAERAKQQLGGLVADKGAPAEATESEAAKLSAVTGEIETPGPWTDALRADAIVHLAGQSVAARRWDAREKQRVRDSRVESTRVIVEAIAAMPKDDKPRVFVCASGADYYPFAEDFDDDEEVTESAKPGDSFLARVCRDWEKEAFAARQHGVRVVTLRTGFVVGPGGALDKMTTPFKLFVGGRLGSGKQWMSWIHRDDAVAICLAAISDERYAGPINLVTESVRNADFARALGRVMKRPSWLPVPGFAVKAAAGEFAEYVLKGRRVVPAKLRELGFQWKHADLERALADAVKPA